MIRSLPLAVLTLIRFATAPCSETLSPHGRATAPLKHRGLDNRTFFT